MKEYRNIPFPIRALQEKFFCDVERGKFWWKPRPADDFMTKQHARTWNTRYSGKLAGCITERGYRVIGIDGANWPAHRLVWFIATGSMSQQLEIDHINGIKDDNRIANLRACTRRQNGRNTALPTSNSSGVVGVHWDAANKKWVSQIGARETHEFLGRFSNIQDAIVARRAAERRLGFHPNHGRPPAETERWNGGQ